MVEWFVGRLKYPGLPLAIVVGVWLYGHYEELAGRQPDGSPPTADEVRQNQQAAADFDRRQQASLATLDD